MTDTTAETVTETALQIVARGPRAEAEAGAARIDADPLLEGVTYSILEEDEDRGLWRIFERVTARC